MKEDKIDLINKFIYNNNPSFYAINNIFTNIGYSILDKKYVYIKKYQNKLKLCKNLIFNPEINNLEFVQNILDFIIKEDILIIQAMDDFMPLKLFTSENFDNFDYLYILTKNLISLSLNSNFFQNISEFLDIDDLWIDKDFKIKICWFSFTIKYENYFDNSIFKTNINKIEGVINLFNYNKKRLQKRSNKNVPVISTSKLYDFTENFFKLNSSPINKKKDFVKYNEKITTSEKGSVRICGSKKLCVENIKRFCKSQKDKKLDFTGIKLIILKILFKGEMVSFKNSDIYIAKLKEIYSAKNFKGFNLSRKLKDVIQFIINEHTQNFNFVLENMTNDFVIQFVKNLKTFYLKDESKFLNSKSDLKIEPLENVFKERGFNMADFNTKSYKKGRFYVCQAIPNISTKTSKSNVDLNKIFHIIEIQNKQIEMMYQTLKEKDNIDILIDSQLKSLSLQVNEILTDLNNNEK